MYCGTFSYEKWKKNEKHDSRAEISFLRELSALFEFSASTAAKIKHIFQFPQEHTQITLVIYLNIIKH